MMAETADVAAMWYYLPSSPVVDWRRAALVHATNQQLVAFSSHRKRCLGKK
eukprot:CAMPEP_0204574928 /NCGR_PEP_ID=MMETSP0661-20131031/40892_1 /ASSEMBLY_ACC=CAM_ASM_000606 /TAXON_ID=109239 /ORGANISM="Alexandrium margalefi, Strain AMGDE01CS-322" /LENGTH=50 /DNA_ID=CAMNT_0051583501 /DNA_START=14 /DNA_END=163 /DNA_ORIENTATION=+